MGTAGLGLVLGGLFVVGCGCLPWWCRVVCHGACWRVVLRVCPAWPACGSRSLPGRAVAQARGHSVSLAGPFGSMAGLVGARLWPGARQWGVCTFLEGGVGSSPLAFRALSLCPFSPACPACLPSSHPLGWPWLDGWCWWSVWVFLSCRAAWPGFVLGAGCSCGLPCRVYGALGLLAPVHRRACPVCGVACAVSWAAWLLFTGVRALCVALRVRCPGPPGSCSPACTPCVWCCVYGVLGLLGPVHRCARSVCGVVCTVSWASWVLFTGVRALCVVLCVRCPGPPCSCSPVCTLCVWCCVFGVLGLLAPVHRCVRSVCGVACTVSWASWLLFTGVHALCVVLRVRCPWPPGSCSPACTFCVWGCVYGVLGLLAPVHRFARPVCGVVGAMSWAAWLLFTGVHALCAVLCARCPGPLGSCAPVCLLWCAVSCVRCPWPLGSGSPPCTLCVRCRVRGLLGLLAPFCWCARVVCVVLRVWCPATLGSWSPVLRCAAMCVVFGVRCCVCGVLGRLAPVHRCARCVCGVACTVSWASWLLFTGVHALCVVLRVRCPGPPGSCSPVCALCVWCCVHGVLGRLAPVHRCARSVCGVVCTVSWASWLLFTGVHALCVVLRVHCPGPLGSCPRVCTLCVWCCVYGVLGLLAPVQRCARSVCGVACTVSWASWLLFTGVHVLCVGLRVRCSGPPGSCSPVCTPCVWCCGCDVLGRLAPVHRRARSVCGVVCAVSWAAWLLCTGVPALVCCVLCTVSGAPWLWFPSVHALCAVSCAWSPGPFGPLLLVCSCGVCCVACVVSCDTWFVFSGVVVCCGVCGVWCAVLRVRCPGPLGPCSPVCALCVWCCVYGVLGLLAPVHGRARPVCGVACTVSWASWLLFTGVRALCVVLCARCPGSLGSCSPVCAFCVWCCVYGVLGLLAPVHRCAGSVCGVVCTVSWASWLLFTGVRALCVVLRVHCPGPLGSCSPVCTLCVWCCVYGVLGLLAPVHRCARSVCGVACTVSWASWLLFTGVHVLCVVLRVRCPGPPGSCSPVCTPCVWCCGCGVLGRLAPVHRRARSVCGVVRALPWAAWLLCTGVPALVCCVLCTVSWAPWLWFPSVHALCAVSCAWSPGPFGPFLLVCSCGVCCVACVVSCDTWFVFSGVVVCCGVCGVRCAVLRVRCPGPLGPCSPVCALCVWCCVYGVLGLLAPVHGRARPVCGVACTVSWASWLLFTGVRALCVVLCARCPGSLGSCSPVCAFCVWCCVYGVLGLLAPVHRCARSVCGVVCTVSWASWLLFTGVRALCVVLRVHCPGPLGSCSPVCTLCVWCCVYGVLGLLAPVHRCARSVCGVACTVSWASWLLFTGVHVLCVVLRVRCLGPPGSCSPVCTPCVWCCGCSVLGRLAPVHRRARSVCGVVRALPWAAWLLCTGVPALVCCVLCTVSCAPWLWFTGVHALCAVSCAWSPGPFGPFLLVCSCGVCCVACVVSSDTWFVVSGVAVCCGVCGVRCAVLRVRCPGPPGPCSPVRTPGVWCCVGGVLGRLAPVHRCACAVCCAVCLVSWASWLPVTGVPVLCVARCVRCPGPLGSRSPVCPCGVCCVACSVSGASWLLFTGVLCACSVFSVLCAVSPGHVAPVHRCACSVCCVVCVVWVWVCARVCHTVLVAFSVAPKSRRRRCIHGSDTVGNAASYSLLGFWPTRRPASYEVLLILPVLDSLILATPKSKRVLLHAWRCMLFTPWFVYSL